jgi:hypothetical protein
MEGLAGRGQRGGFSTRASQPAEPETEIECETIIGCSRTAHGEFAAEKKICKCYSKGQGEQQFRPVLFPVPACRRAHDEGVHGCRINLASDCQTKRFASSPVRNLEAYLFRAFLRRLNKTKKRQLRVDEAIGLLDSTQNIWRPRNSVKMKILVDEFLRKCDVRP